MTKWGDGALVLAVALAGWQAIVWLTGAPPFILPGPLKVAQAMVTHWALLAENAYITLIEVILGLILGTLIGAATALHLMISPAARRFLLPVLVFNQAVPVFALAPVLTLWFGYGIVSKIVVTILIVYFPVTWTFYDGLRRTDPGLLDLAQTMGVSERRVLTHLRLPAALPAFGSGLKLAAIYAPIGAVFGEWVGASKGLGYLMLLSNGRAKIDLMFAALFVLAIMTVILHAGIDKLAQRLTAWATGTSKR